jgi:hypothetical protein
MNKVWMILMSVSLLGLVGCQERYRYPCQDPLNWEKEECKKPLCSANGTCPEDLKHYEKNKPVEVPVKTDKGACK